jgi:hypothetical protein
MYTLLQLAVALQQLHQLLRRRKKRRRLTWVAAWTCKCYMIITAKVDFNVNR